MSMQWDLLNCKEQNYVIAGKCIEVEIILINKVSQAQKDKCLIYRI